jgi:hypothetical protein
MAKQSFSVGQVLTAAQMLSLQQTAMLGGSTTAKTTSYTLVAADAGSVVSVNSTSATTITINTGLFSAGDTVTIQNWGTGSVTITAGTATVNTAGSLIVPQYDGGVLYFTSASASIYFDFVQAGATSPLTTKGDVYVFGTSDTRLAVGANGTVLTADSTVSPTGLKWQAVAAGSDYKLINTTSFSAVGSQSVNSVFKSTYDTYKLIVNLIPTSTTDTVTLRLRASGTDTTANYTSYRIGWNGSVVFGGTNNSGSDDFYFGLDAVSSTCVGSEITLYRPNVASQTNFSGLGNSATQAFQVTGGIQADSTQFDGFTIAIISGTFTGNVSVYGLAK